MMVSDARLLREYIRAVIAEDDGGYGYDALMSDAVGMSPYGVHFGDGNELYKIFVQPFVDVVETALGKTKELVQHGMTVVKVAFETVATSLIPILRDSYADIFAKEKEEIDRIKDEYAEVYQSNWDAFKDNDVTMVAFMYAPAAFLTQKLARSAPQATAKMLSVLTGGSLDPWLKRVARHAGWDNKRSTGHHKHGKEGPGMPFESVIREAAVEQGQRPDLAGLLVSKQVLARVQQSPLVKQMEQQGRSIVRGTLARVYKHAKDVLSSSTLHDLQTRKGKQLPGVDKLAQLPQEERQKAERAVLEGAKQSMRAFYVKNLEGQVDEALKAGVSEQSPYVLDYRKTIARIKSL